MIDEKAEVGAKHQYIEYPSGSTFAMIGRSCVKCGLPPENAVHDTDEPPRKIETINEPEKLYE